MLRTLILLLLVLPTAVSAQAVEYEIAFPNLVHHEASITVTFRGVPAGAPLEVRMSRTSPGRYALHEFAKNVYSVAATSGAGRPLTITRPDPHQWDVHDHDGTVTFRYTLFGDRADGTYTGIDNTHAHLNIPATFAWARGMEDRPVTVVFHAPRPDWRIATQLVPTADPARFTAPDLQYFMDSPTEISAFHLRSWEIEQGGRRQTIRLAVHHLEGEGEVDRFASMARAVVDEQIAVFGAPPAFDHGDYIFIACYTPWVHGDGMEHRNSTILTSPRPLSTGALQNLGTLSHEFFHVWNVERLRPRSLEPFDFEEANMSGELWFAEGFTSYYTNLIIRRAGLFDDAQYAATLTPMLNTVINAPGRRFASPVEMSLQAPFVDAATSVDPQNRANTFISYYTWGAAIGLGLDLTLRERFGLSLDHYMRAAWDRFGPDERPYTMDDLRSVLREVTGDTAFVDDFFGRYVEGREVPDFQRLLARAGYTLRPVAPQRPWIGLTAVAFEADGARLTGPSLIGTPLYQAGVGTGDLIVDVGGRSVGSEAELAAAVEPHLPGQRVSIRYRQRGEERRAELTVVADPRLEVVPTEATGVAPSPDEREFRAGWLDSRVRR